MRVLLISLGSIVVFGMIVLTTRFWGLGVVFTKFEHPFFKESEVITVLKVNAPEEIPAALKVKPDMVFWLNVEATFDGKMIAFAKEISQKEMSMEAYRGAKPYAYTYQQLVLQNPQIRLLHDVVAAYPTQRFIINVVDNIDNVHLWTSEQLKGLNAEKRIILQSDFNVVMESIKKLEPFWLYGCSQADLMRFLTFQGMWLLPATPFKGDVFIAPFKLLGRPGFRPEAIAEVHRRFKKVLLGPVMNKAQFDDAARLKADGLIVNNLADYLTWSRP